MEAVRSTGRERRNIRQIAEQNKQSRLEQHGHKAAQLEADLRALKAEAAQLSKMYQAKKSASGRS